MAAGLFGEALLGAAVGELLKAVLEEGNKTVQFKSTLNRLQTTLLRVRKTFDEMDKLNKVLGRPKEETEMFMDLLRRGEEMVRKCSRIGCWNVWKKFIYSNKLLKLEGEVLRFFQIDVTMQEARDTRNILVVVNNLNEKVERMLPVGGLCGVPGSPVGIVGLDGPLQELKVMLLKDGVSVLLLSAPGGCGKTTLAKMLCNHDQIKDIFRDIFFVTVSKTGSLKVVVQKLFQHKCRQQPEFQSDEDAINQLEQLLRQIGKHPILLVLDDVWSGWESNIRNLMFQMSGYKILVTSRYMFPEFDPTYKLNILNDQDAKTLFHRSAFPQDGNSNVPDDLVNKIVKGCKGFPLALTVVGRSLCGRPEVSWRSMLKKWSEGQSIFYSNSDVLLSLQTSIDALNEKTIIKDLYLDLGSFPEDQKIPATALMDMWVELYNLDEEGIHIFANLHELSFRNLIDLVPTRKDARDLDNEHYVTQHDLLRELAIHQSSQEPIEWRKRLIVEISGNDFPNWWIEQMQQPFHARLLSITTDETFSTSWYYMQLPEVEVLILNFRTRNYTLPQFMERMDQLKVLIVINYGFSPVELNNFSVLGYLSNLRRIRLEHVSISALSTSLMQMRNLRKISLIMCEIGVAFVKCTTEIPHMLPNLSEIEIKYCDDLAEFPAGLCDIVHLKKLCVSYCNELSALPEGFGRLTNLEVLSLHSCTKLVELPESIGSIHKLRVLDISDCVGMSKMPDRMGELCGLKRLHVRGCRGLLELPPSVEDLQGLEEVICDEEIFYVWKSCESFLPNLKINVVREDINLHWLHNVV